MVEPVHFVHPELWRRLRERNPDEVCRNAMVGFDGRAFRVPFLKEAYAVDPYREAFHVLEGTISPSSELQVAVLEYLLGAKELPLKGKWILLKDLKGGRGFALSHPLPLDPVLDHYGEDPEGFLRRGLELGGEREGFGDASFRLPALPRVPLLLVLWRGDEEFGPRLNLLFDLTAQEHMPLDALYGLAVEVCHRLSS